MWPAFVIVAAVATGAAIFSRLPLSRQAPTADMMNSLFVIAP
jgi:hypothetical protein